jgi:hypothetical protein
MSAGHNSYASASICRVPGLDLPLIQLLVGGNGGDLLVVESVKKEWPTGNRKVEKPGLCVIPPKKLSVEILHKPTVWITLVEVLLPTQGKATSAPSMLRHVFYFEGLLFN